MTRTQILRRNAPTYEARGESELEDTSGVGEAYELYFGLVWKYVALMTQNQAEADEFSSEVFERALKAYPAGGHPKGDWLPWLMLVARRLMISRWRHRRLVRIVPLIAAEMDRSESRYDFDDAELRLWLDQITATLPERQREVLFLRYMGDLDDRRVGQILGLSPSGVRSLTARAIAALREHEELWR